MAAPGTVQLGARLVRRGAGEGRTRRAARAEDPGRRRGNSRLRRAVGDFVAPRQRPARARRPARRSDAADARQRRALVGRDAGGDEARPGRDPRDDAADWRRHRRSPRAGPRAFRDRRRRRRCQIRGAGGGFRTHRGRGRPGGLVRLCLAAESLGAFRAGRADSSRRSDAALFHLGHDCAAQARHAQSCELPDRAPLDHVRPGVEAGRSASQHFLARLGQARLVERLRALERGGMRCRARKALRGPRDARRSRRARDHVVLRAADRLAPS